VVVSYAFTRLSTLYYFSADRRDLEDASSTVFFSFCCDDDVCFDDRRDDDDDDVLDVIQQKKSDFDVVFIGEIADHHRR